MRFAGSIRVNICFNGIFARAGIAQPVERNLAKVEVASSNLVSRSIFLAPLGGMAEWLCSGLQSRQRRFNSDSRLHFTHQPGWWKW